MHLVLLLMCILRDSRLYSILRNIWLTQFFNKSFYFFFPKFIHITLQNDKNKLKSYNSFKIIEDIIFIVGQLTLLAARKIQLHISGLLPARIVHNAGCQNTQKAETNSTCTLEWRSSIVEVQNMGSKTPMFFR